ncbi:MAG TPA: HAD-IC family P-type ATPase [Fimbriiglobus sp.]|nr:HAD-IC family P-type ATPase [Fimbriiglobus sp.]
MASSDGSDVPGGLTAAEVADRVARGQVNRPPASGWAEYRDILARNTLTLFNALVVPAAVALFLLADYRAAWAVSGMAVANTLIGLAQEVRAKRHLDQLALLAETKARVRRDGRDVTVPAGDVVLGDVVVLADGEPVVADGTVLTANFLEVDEALLTGESDPVPRRPGDRLLSGSFCVAGNGAYRADRVGGESFANQTSAQARLYRYTPSPIQRTLDALIRVLTAAAITLCLGYVGLSAVRGFGATDLVQMIAATITSMVPQGLVLMATLAFVLGAVRMARRGAVVQRLNAVEAMASVDVLCLDKTGTLTTGRLTLDRVEPLDDAAVRDKLRLFAYATIDAGNKSVQALRDALGPQPGPFELVDQVPFKAQNRYSAVRIRAGGRETVLALGAVEALKPFLAPADAERAEKHWRELLPTGLRLLLFAEGDPGPPFAGSLAGQSLRPLALVALSDELRPEAGAVLEALAGQGIAFKVLSGDHPETVRATISHLNLPLAREPIVTGGELEAAADPAAVIARSSVFGRVAPQQKLDIVTALQARGHRVAMLGDGVNDVLPIKRSDLGVAMGAGSPAARTVAAVVLETNDFGLLPAMLDEGRVIVNNLRRAAKLFLLKNVYTVLLVVAALGLLDLGFPYLPQQVTLLNALTIGGPALLIMASKAQPRPGPRPAFLREVGWYAVAAGLVTGTAGLVVWLVSARQLGHDFRTQQTLLLTTLVLAGLGNVLIAGEGERRLVVWAALAVPVYAAVMYLPPTQFFFELAPLTLPQWALAAGAAAVAVTGCVRLAPTGRAHSAGGYP